MRRVLLTGGSGFVGTNLARQLVSDGHTVHLLVRPEHAAWRIEDLKRQVSLHTTALDDEPGLRRLVETVQPEWVFHLAAHGAYPTQQDVEAMIRTNLTGTITLLRACLAQGVAAFVHTGSSSEYGFKTSAPRETDWIEPNSPYAVTKAAATLYCRHVALTENAPVRTLRLYSVYGPWEEPTRLLPTLVLHALGGTLPSLAAPEIARDFVHVDDAVAACLRAAEVAEQPPGAVYNVGTGVQTTLAAIVDIAREVIGVSAEPRWGSMPARSWDTSVWVADASMIRRTLRWEPRIELKDGIRRLADWFRGRPDVTERYRRAIGLS